MKWFYLMICTLSFNVFSQDTTSQLQSLDSKVYSLKSKGASDFVVDVESSKLTKQVNDQLVFGPIKELVFRTYWTANPERLAIEIIGLPEGFKEIKDELKANILMVMENLLPLQTTLKFLGYKISAGTKPKEFIAQDTTGIATIPTYILVYDSQDKLVEVIGKKPVGTLNIEFGWGKEAFADGKWVLNSVLTVAVENGQTLTTKKTLDYELSQGMGVLQSVEIETTQKSVKPDAKTLNSKEVVRFEHYKINTGEGLKYFLSEGNKITP
jgi:hypothetical protein